MTATSVQAGEVIFGTLESLGVTHVFGLPGTQTVPLFEALRRSRLTTIVPTHELAAAFMAGAFYRVSGRPAVLLTIPGPGFTYALTGLAEARLDSAALIHLVPAAAEGPDARFRLQALPQAAIAGQLCNGVLRLEGAGDADAVLRRAFGLATSCEPGPVVVQLGDGSACEAAAVPSGRVAETWCTSERAAALWHRIATARRPVILAGQGCLHVAADLQGLAERLRAPVLTTASARGLLPEDHELAMGFDVHRGTTGAVNALIAGADLVLVLGARLGHNGTAGHTIAFPQDRTLHVDTDAAVLGRVCPPEACACLPVEQFLAGGELAGVSGGDWTSDEIVAARRAIGESTPNAAEPRISGESPRRFFEALRGALPRDAIVVTDSGLHQVLTRRHLPVLAPGGLLIPSDLQSMGFGLPAAIAARLAAPHRPVVAIVGDGGMAMSGLELATAARLRLPLPVIVFADGELNQIRLHQQSEFGSAFGVDLPELDFEALAAATGAAYAAVGVSLATAVTTALATAGPTLIEVPVRDSVGIRRVRALARTKALVRRSLGDRLVARLRRLR